MSQETLNDIELKIYTRFTEITELSKGDRITLQKKRGFTNEIINEFKLRSGHKDVVEPAIELIKKRFCP